MRTFLIAACLGGMLILPACADDGAYYGAGYGVGYGYGPDVYYDNFYGPYTDGYWGPDNYFYYRGGDGRFLRDEGRHFRHEQFEHAQRFRAQPFDRGRDDDRR